MIKISLAAMVKMHWKEIEFGHSCSGLSVDDKGTGGSVRVQSEKQTHNEYCGIWIYYRNRC